ncbi:MAG: hypothetical protein Q8Q80_07805 [Methyloversatilis sp.]|uniref:hypothetical protein n=1 Tax=Methyloversatilis sp. TaxID=2569862 RepID=UPI0027365341|nr:hypothetical protein [Methyloversatilis sp.]MDP3872552.1 hypothetical protein [Methyloversatilis sp.]
MPTPLDHLEPDDSLRLQQLSRLMYETREHRRDVLAAAGAGDEEALLQAILDRRMDEHPAYEHYLAARVLNQAHDSARQETNALLLHLNTQ